MDLVTGATGLSGSYLVCRLLKSGRRVRALHRPGSDRSWFYRIARFELGANADMLLQNLEWFEGDVIHADDVQDAVNGCDRVYHTAALVSFRDGDKEELMRVNVGGTAHVVNACLYAQPQPELCHFSSTATMGKADGLIDESTTFVSDEDTSFYARSKYQAELEAIRGREEGLKVAIINPCIILGFGNTDRGPSRFFRNARKSFPFYPPGSNAFVDVRDVADYAVDLMENKVFSNRFLCIGFNATYKAIFTEMAEEFNTKPPRIGVQPWMVEVAWRLTSVTRYLGIPSLISRSSARAGMKLRSFSSAALIGQLGNQFTEQSACIREHVARYDSE